MSTISLHSPETSANFTIAFGRSNDKASTTSYKVQRIEKPRNTSTKRKRKKKDHRRTRIDVGTWFKLMTSSRVAFTTSKAHAANPTSSGAASAASETESRKPTKERIASEDTSTPSFSEACRNRAQRPARAHTHTQTERGSSFHLHEWGNEILEAREDGRSAARHRRLPMNSNCPGKDYHLQRETRIRRKRGKPEPAKPRGRRPRLTA